MPLYLQELPYSPDLLELIVTDIEVQAAKDAARAILRRFDEANRPIKVKHLFPEEPCGYYRVQCFVKKSKEAVIINTKTDDGHKNTIGGMNVQLRIENRDTLTKLDEMSDNIRDQILGAGNCRHCCTKCEGKQYSFAYKGTDYLKCHFICSNFRFSSFEAGDLPSLMRILGGEIDRKRAKSAPGGR